MLSRVTVAFPLKLTLSILLLRYYINVKDVTWKSINHVTAITSDLVHGLNIMALGVVLVSGQKWQLPQTTHIWGNSL